MSKPKRKTARRQASPYEVFKLLQDGQWHAASELKRRFGVHGDRRARQLRAYEYGEFDVQRASPHELQSLIEAGELPLDTSYYRISDTELSNKTFEAAALRQHMRPNDVDVHAKRCSLTLSRRDMLWVFAALTQPGFCDRKDVSEQWTRTRDRVIHKLTAIIPAEMQSPLFALE